MIRAVIFDLDNTVYDYDACNTIALGKLCRHVCSKYHLTHDMFEKKFGQARKQVKEQLGDTGAAHNRILYMQALLELIGEPPAENAIELYDVYWNSVLENMRLYRYVEPLIKYLHRESIRIGVLTDLTAHIQHRKIRRLNLQRHIDALVTSEEVGKEKPSRIAFDKIKDKLGVPADEILVVGDSLEKDIRGARNAGMHGLLFKKELESGMYEICVGYINERMD